MQHPRRFIILACLLIASIVSVSAVHGVWTDRWRSSDDAREVAEMEKMPIKIGAWEGQTIWEESTRAALPDAANCLVRRYVNRTDGTVASILLTRGRPGPMVIKHLPTECYPSSGYEQVGPIRRFESPAKDGKPSNEFWVATFKKNTGVYPVTIRIYWSWSADGHWQIPDRPRLTFAGATTLYKLYVTQNIRHEADESEGAPVQAFIKELTGAMRGSIFASSPG